ncbi:MAG: carboxypeptidase-like regulatory domain-containing protein [Planctomycetota bacterium]
MNHSVQKAARGASLAVLLGVIVVLIGVLVIAAAIWLFQSEPDATGNSKPIRPVDPDVKERDIAESPTLDPVHPGSLEELPEPEPLPEVPVNGVVLGPDDELLEGAWIYSAPGAVPPEPEEVGRLQPIARTDRDGKFRANAPWDGTSVGLLVCHEELAPAALSDLKPAESGEISIEVQLEVGGTVEGIVYDVEDQPLSGVEVRLASASTLTDRQGRYRLQGAPEGEWTLWAMARGFQPAEIKGIAVTARKSLQGIDIELKELVKIRGEVRNEAGLPVAGAKVAAIGPLPPRAERRPLAVTGADGTFTIGGLITTVYELKVTAAGYVQPRPVSATAPSDELILDLQPGFELEVRLIGPEGHPYRGRFDLSMDSAERQEVLRRSFANTRADEPGVVGIGTFGPGAYVLRVETGGWYGRETLDLQIGRDPGVIPVYLDDRPPTTLRGRVLRSDGAPISDVNVWIGGGPGSRIQRGSLEAARAREVAISVTDSEGRFLLEHVPGGEVAVFLSGVSIGLDRDVVRVSLGEIQEIQIEVEQTAAANGRIRYRDESGRIARSGRVRFASEDVLLDVRTDNGGRYVTGPIPPGDYELSVFDYRNNLLDQRMIRLEPGERASLHYDQ